MYLHKCIIRTVSVILGRHDATSRRVDDDLILAWLSSKQHWAGENSQLDILDDAAHFGCVQTVFGRWFWQTYVDMPFIFVHFGQPQIGMPSDHQPTKNTGSSKEVISLVISGLSWLSPLVIEVVTVTERIQLGMATPVHYDDYWSWLHSIARPALMVASTPRNEAGASKAPLGFGGGNESMAMGVPTNWWFICLFHGKSYKRWMINGVPPLMETPKC